MTKKKMIVTVLIQFFAIFFIVDLFIIDKIDEDQISIFLSINTLWLFLYLSGTKLIIPFLFLIILNTISLKKNSYLNITDIFLMGGIINQILPGSGFIYKFYKLKTSSNISVIEYSASQSIWSFYSLFAYVVLGLIFGFIFISNTNNSKIIALISILTIFVTLVYFKRKYIYSQIIKIKLVNKVYSELSRIKNTFKNKLLLFIFIFFGFIILALLECIGFYTSLKVFGAENILFWTTSYTYISSSIASVILIINYFGLFELLLTISSKFIMPSVEDIIFYGVCFRVINTSALAFVASISAFLNYISNSRGSKNALK